jgi:hypothetical protein
MSAKRKIVYFFLFVIIGIQFIRPVRNVDQQGTKRSIYKLLPVPERVRDGLQTACHDCHSNNTNYLWYANIQPMGWLIAKHIRNGKAELNFDEFGIYSKRRRISKLRSVQNSIKDGSMPLASYTMLHKDARLSTETKESIIEWTNKMIDSLSMENNR